MGKAREILQYSKNNSPAYNLKLGWGVILPRIVLALVLLATLLLGRGLGHFYLSNMAEGTPEIPTRNVFLTSEGISG